MAGSVEVSVVMPVYNAERYLAETVESILAQSCADFELIAVDDGSNDGSLGILGRFAERDARVRIVSRPNTGIAGARNDGFEAARAGLVACIDNDDLMEPHRLELQVAHMQRHPECVLVGGAALRIDPDGDPLAEWRCPLEHEALEAELLQGRNPLIHPAVMVRRAAVLAAGGYREQANFAEDFDLYLRLADRGRFACLPEIVIRHREHLGRASYATFERQRQVIEAALKEAYARRGLAAPVPPVPAAWHPTSRRAFHIRCCCDAWDGGYAATARKHAVTLFKCNPFSPRGWDMLARTHLGVRTYGLIAAAKTLLRPLKGLGRIPSRLLQATGSGWRQTPPRP